MTTVRILKDWSYPDINRQTPGCSGMWKDVKFIQDDSPSDYVIILNTPSIDVCVNCPRENLWLLLQEPMNEITDWMQEGRKEYSRVYTTDSKKRGRPFVRSQTALPWHVDRDYDFLKKVKPGEKTKPISCITSSTTLASGHRRRMEFVSKLQKNISFDLFGRGFNFINDKWDGLASYKYSLAVESHSSPYYWTEKIADCFLAWTMPIYYGCTRITEYFPKEAIVCIDINDSNAIDIIKESINSDLWRINIDAIEYARNKVLDEYQFFPFITHEISAKQSKVHMTSPGSLLTVRSVKKPISRMTRLRKSLSTFSFYPLLRHYYHKVKKTKL